MPGKVRDEIAYPFPHFNGSAVEVWEWISYFIPHFIMDAIIYPTLGLKLIHVSNLWRFRIHIMKINTAHYDVTVMAIHILKTGVTWPPLSMHSFIKFIKT